MLKKKSVKIVLFFLSPLKACSFMLKDFAKEVKLHRWDLAEQLLGHIVCTRTLV